MFARSVAQALSPCSHKMLRPAGLTVLSLLLLLLAPPALSAALAEAAAASFPQAPPPEKLALSAFISPAQPQSRVSAARPPQERRQASRRQAVLCPPLKGRGRSPAPAGFRPLPTRSLAPHQRKRSDMPKKPPHRADHGRALYEWKPPKPPALPVPPDRHLPYLHDTNNPNPPSSRSGKKQY